MMWFVIIAIITLVLSKFFWDKHRLEASIRKRGGMRVVYSKIITLLMEQHPKSKIFNERSSYICLGVADKFATTIFELVATFGSVTIVYKAKSMLFGDHRLEWTFNDADDPEYIFYKMNTDIKSYMENIGLTSKI